MSFEITVLCDAEAAYPEPVREALPTLPHGRRPAWGRLWPSAVDAAGGWRLHFHSFLIRTTAVAVLVDTGIGPAGTAASGWLGTAGRLPDLLSAVGLETSDIGLVVLTHLHLDHVGWNVRPDGTPLFASARYVVQHDELAAANEAQPSYQQQLAPLLAAGQVQVVDGEVEVLPGVRLLPTPGHTVGHQSVLVENVLLAGDAFVHPAQLLDPTIGYAYETDPEQAVATRTRLLTRAAHERLLLAPCHLDAAVRVAESAGEWLVRPAPELRHLGSPQREAQNPAARSRGASAGTGTP